MKSQVLEPAQEPMKHRSSKKIVITILVAVAVMACECPLGIGMQSMYDEPLQESKNGPIKDPLTSSTATIQVKAPTKPTATKASVSADLVGSWHGDKCDEAEGTFIYRWSLDLIKDPATGQVMGTLKFHDCPGGGRALFRVVGAGQSGTVITLTGTLKDGGGELFQALSTETTSFTFDSTSGEIDPDLTQ